MCASSPTSSYIMDNPKAGIMEESLKFLDSFHLSQTLELMIVELRKQQSLHDEISTEYGLDLKRYNLFSEPIYGGLLTSNSFR